VSLKREIELVLGLAEGSGHHDAVNWIEKRWAQEDPSREWVFGSCVWCEIDFNCRREATDIDSSGGPNLCALHAWLLPEPPARGVRLLREIASGAEIGDDEQAAEELEVLTSCDLIVGHRLKWGGRKALEYLERAA
jgi:hypothetical protein